MKFGKACLMSKYYNPCWKNKFMFIVVIQVMFICWVYVNTAAATVVPTVHVAGAHSVQVKADGTVRTWGHNGSGQLGNGTTESRTVPGIVSGMSNAISAAVGYDRSYAGAACGWNRVGVGL